jgi:hypothetical protein
MRFGLYLFHKGIITADQLVAAWETQSRNQPQLGQLAIEEGKLSVKDLFRILRVQSDLTRDRLGETAIELGLMTRRDLAELLMLQSDRQRPLQDILVEHQALTAEQAQAELEAFRHSMERGNASRRGPGAGVDRQTFSLAVSLHELEERITEADFVEAC